MRLPPESASPGSAVTGTSPNVLLFPTQDTLAWEVIPDNGTPPYTMDLNEFSSGDPSTAVRSRFNLIRQIAPAIRIRSRGRAIHFKYDTASNLRTLWQFLDSLAEAVGTDIDDLSLISDAMGSLLKTWLLRKKELALTTARANLAALHLLLSLSRQMAGISQDVLLWPTIQQDRGTKHVDVEPEALAQLYRYAKQLHRGFRSAESEGRALLEQAHSAKTTITSARACKSCSDVAFLVNAFLVDGLVDSSLNLRPYAGANFFNQVITQGPLYIREDDRRPFDAVRWYAPASEDAAAAFILVLLHTGWNPETIFNIDITSPDNWYSDRLSDSNEPSTKSTTVAIYGFKGRSAKEQISFCLKNPWAHPFQVIKYMIRRTEPLRRSLREELEALESIGSPTLPQRQRKSELKIMIRSPWLYVKRGGGSPRGDLSRVSMLSSRTMYNSFKSVCEQAIEHISPLITKHKRETIATSLEDLKLTDVRDGFAAFIYDNSLSNILLLKHALGHGSIKVTRHYLRQRRQLKDRFSQFTTFQESFFAEVRDFNAVDSTVLFLRVSSGQISNEQRQRLADYRLRTRMNMGCLDPYDPPDMFSNSRGGYCTVQRCTLCRHGVVFDDSFPEIAMRKAELLHIRSTSPADSFANSTFAVELSAIEILLEQVFPLLQNDIDNLTNEHLQKLRAGEIFLFNQSPAI